MSQIFTGEGLGLAGSSLDCLGGYGPRGQAGFGQGDERVYINAANGNLVLRQADGFLADHNLGTNLVQTYNEQGKSGAGRWVFNVNTRLSGVYGTLNQSGSYIERVDEGGHKTRFDYDEKTRRYMACDGSSARLCFDGQNWRYQRGSGEVCFLYNQAGRLEQKINQDGGVVSYHYQNDVLTSITDANRQKICFDYRQGRLCDIYAKSKGETIHHLHYEYDGQNRLYKVSQDLGLGKRYSIEYGYDGDSERISDIWQSDGSSYHIDYDAKGRVKKTTDGEGRWQRFEYGRNETTITDASGQRWTYRYDAQSRLVGIDGPEGYHITYDYDGKNHVKKIVQGEHIWQFDYNDNGDCIRMVNEKGQLTERVFDSEHRLVRETKYQNFDDKGNATSPASQYFVYDDKGHLRFSLSANGVVTEYGYDDQGDCIAKTIYLDGQFDVSPFDGKHRPTLSQLTDWAKRHQADKTDKTIYEYDDLGLLKKQRRYHKTADKNGQMSQTSIDTTYVYDAAGRLLAKATPYKGGLATTQYVYDDLGRLIQVIDNEGCSQRIDYDDAHSRIVKTDMNGLKTIELFDQSGRLISKHRLNETQDFGTEAYRYDNTGRLRQKKRANGEAETYFYDGKGQLCAVISAIGQVTEYQYDAYGNQIGKTSYATQTAPLSWGQEVPEFASIRPDQTSGDRHVMQIYDKHNQLHYQIDDKGGVIEYAYDGQGRIITKTAYANRLPGKLRPGDLSMPPIKKDSAHDRCERFFYDNQGNLIGKVNGEGYATQYRYNHCNQLVETRHFDNPIGQGQSWDEIKPSPSRKDIATFCFYDETGLKIADINGDGYLSEYVYNDSGQRIETIAYAKKAKAPIDADQALAQLRPNADKNDYKTTYDYDDLGRLSEEKNNQGLVVSYRYNEQGQITAKTRTDACNQQSRQLLYRYDAMGRIIARLDEIGVALLAKSPATQAKAIWQAHSIGYQYDLIGNLICETNQLGQQTHYYYDNARRLRFSIDADGRAKEYQYNEFDQMACQIDYSKRLQGALPLSVAEAGLQVKKLADDKKDVIVTYRYNTLGQLVEKKRGTQQVVTDYNAFGEQEKITARIDSERNQITELAYDRRGILDIQQQKSQTITQESRLAHDAFGRLTDRYDNGVKVSHQEYDKRGNITYRFDANNPNNSNKGYAYDAFNRVVSEVMGGVIEVTRFEYDDAKGMVTTFYQDAGRITVAHNAFGENIAYRDGNGNETCFRYDEKGQLIEKTFADGHSERFCFDEAGRLSWQDEAGSHRIDYTYDASKHMLSKTIDKHGLNLRSTYEYDGVGRNVLVTDAKGMQKRFAYNENGDLIEVVTDVQGLHLKTQFDYDDAGNQVLEKRINANGDDWVIAYRYDGFGRITDKIIDPSGFSLHKKYEYDAWGNQIARYDANGNKSQYLYDNNHQCRFGIDAKGYVTEHVYDNRGNEIKTIAYAHAIEDKSNLSLETISDRLQKDKTCDQLTVRSYDTQNRLNAVFDPQGFAVRFIYDDNGNVVTKIRLKEPVESLDANRLPLLESKNIARIDYVAYDEMNRVKYKVDADGYVSECRYDAFGNVSRQIQYANPLALRDNTLILARQLIAQKLRPHESLDQMSVYEYDAAGRLKYKANAMGYVSEYRYDANDNLVATIAYQNQIDNPDAPIAEQLTPASGDRVAQHLYDAANRERYRIGASGSVMEQRFDDNGNIIEQITYEDKIRRYPASLEQVARLLKEGASQARKTAYRYDNANRLYDKINAKGFVEHYQYDDNGNVTEKPMRPDASGNMPTTS